MVSQYYWPEPFRITGICEALVELGHSVDVLTSVPSVPLGRFYDGYGWFKRGEKEHNGVNIERVGVFPRKKGGGMRLALNCASFAVNSLFHLRKFKKNDYDAVFVFNNSPVTKILPAKRFSKVKKIPNIIFLLDIWPQSMFFLMGMNEKGRRTFFRKLAYKVSVWLYKSADLMLLSSEGFEIKLREMGIECEMAYFPNYAEGFEKGEFLLKREELGLDETDFVIAFAGNIGKAQGLGLTVEATLAAGIPMMRWLIIGDGPELAALRNAVVEAGLSDKYIFTGWVDERNLPAYFELSDAAFLPLMDREVLNLTVPAKLQTYMYAKKPVVAFLNGAGAKIVEQAGCGVTAKAEDTGALAAALVKLAGFSTDELKRMGESGRAYCDTNFNKKTQINRLIEHINSAVRHESR